MESAKGRPEKDPEPIGSPVHDPALRRAVLSRTSPVRCPFCHADVRIDADPWVACRGCLARHHVACWQERGRCSTCGATGALRDDMSAGPARARAARFAVGSVALVLLGSLAWLGSTLQFAEPALVAQDLVVAERPPIVVRSPTRSDRRAPDLSHVFAGQTYTYTMTNAGSPPMFMDYAVQEVGRAFVKYTAQMHMDMGQGLAPVGEPTPLEWKHVEPTDPPWMNVDVAYETVTVGGVEFFCMVVSSGNTKTWVPATGDAPTFPGLIKTQTDGKTTMELTRISR